MSKRNRRQLNVQLTPQFGEQLDRYCRKNGIERVDLVRELLRDRLSGDGFCQTEDDLRSVGLIADEIDFGPITDLPVRHEDVAASDEEAVAARGPFGADVGDDPEGGRTGPRDHERIAGDVAVSRSVRRGSNGPSMQGPEISRGPVADVSTATDQAIESRVLKYEDAGFSPKMARFMAEREAANCG